MVDWLGLIAYAAIAVWPSMVAGSSAGVKLWPASSYEASMLEQLNHPDATEMQQSAHRRLSANIKDRKALGGTTG